MNTQKLNDIPHIKPLIASLTLVIGIAVGFGGAAMTIEEESTQSYCQGLENDLKEEYSDVDSLNCHEPGWVAMSGSNEDIDNQTDLECTCTSVQDGDLTIFPIRTPN